MKDGSVSINYNQQPCEVWKTVYSHPLVGFINKYIPNHLYLYHSNERDLYGEGDGKTSIIEFAYSDEVLAITAPQRTKQWYRPRVNLLHRTGTRFVGSTLELKDPYLKDSFTNERMWMVRMIESPDIGKSPEAISFFIENPTG